MACPTATALTVEPLGHRGCARVAPERAPEPAPVPIARLEHDLEVFTVKLEATGDYHLYLNVGLDMVYFTGANRKARSGLSEPLVEAEDSRVHGEPEPQPHRRPSWAFS